MQLQGGRIGQQWYCIGRMASKGQRFKSFLFYSFIPFFDFWLIRGRSERDQLVDFYTRYINILKSSHPAAIFPSLRLLADYAYQKDITAS